MVSPIETAAPAAGAPPSHRRTRWTWALAALLLIVTALRLEHSAWVNSMTSDEMFHIAQGLALVDNGDARAQPENGILIQRMIGWSATWLAAPRLSERMPGTPVTVQDRFDFYQSALYRSGVGNQRLVWAARQAVIACGLLLCLLVFLCSRRLWGEAGGLLSLALVSLSPDVLAHSAVATSDVAFWLFGLSSLYLGWAVVQRPRPVAVLAAGVAIGATFATKFNAALLLPVLGMLWLGHWVGALRGAPRQERGARVRSAASSLAALAAVGVLAWVTLWACYGFERYTGPAGGRLDWALVSRNGISEGMLWLRDSWLFPDTYLYGLQHVLQGASARVSFLAGEIAVQGRAAYFPLALAWKTPVATLVVFALAGGAGLRALRRPDARARWREWLPLLLFALVFATAAIASNLNIGVRHVMPAIIPLFVLAGGLLPALPPARTWVAGALLAVLAVESLAIHPHHLAFFNALAGGPSRGYRLLLDSNLDWGQGLDALARYSQTLPAETPLYYAYFGTAVPQRHGVRGRPLRSYGSFEFPDGTLELEPGMYAISATVLPNMFETRTLRGPWRAELEPAYRELRARSAGGEALAPQETDLLNRLVVIRLLQLLRAREPDLQLDYSILVFRLQAPEVERVLEGPLPP